MNDQRLVRKLMGIVALKLLLLLILWWCFFRNPDLAEKTNNMEQTPQTTINGEHQHGY